MKKILLSGFSIFLLFSLSMAQQKKVFLKKEDEDKKIKEIAKFKIASGKEKIPTSKVKPTYKVITTVASERYVPVANKK